MTQLIRRVLSFARGSQSATISGHDLNRLAEQAHSLLGPLAMGRRVNLLLKTAGQPVAIQANSVQFQQAITNLVLNALDAMPQGGVVELHTGVREATPPAHRDGGRGEYPYCEVIDQGSGISPDVLPHIFEPFFTTKPAGRGTGLGLAVSHGIVHEHGGWIEVDSSPGEGSRFTVYVPPGGADGGTRPHRR
jgi:signal transduction histidine kinase